LDTFHIPSIGDAQVDDYVEDTDVRYRPLDKGEFLFTITEYISSGHYITKKAMQDLFYANQLLSSFVPKEERALMERLEGDIFALQGKQTAANANLINGFAHRYAASGTSGALAISDFSYANLAFNKANVPATGRIAVVDPVAAYDLENLQNIVNLSNNPMWEGVVRDGISTGMRFRFNIMGWDVYVSNRVDTITTETLADAGGNNVNVAGFKANLFLCTAPEAQPFVGAWRQMPEVDEEYNKDKQRWEFVTTARYGLDLYRPESMIVIPSRATV
jgi:hypothetical protein